MTLVQLRHFLSVAQTGSFARSAAALFITQPALSRSIRALEDELGQPLLDRVGRVSELTPFGRLALVQAREVLQAADDLRGSGRHSADGLQGVLRIGLGSGPGALLTTPLLQHVALHLPGLTLEVARGSTEHLVAALRERALDALVVDLLSTPAAADLHVQQVHEMRGAFMVRRAHPLARRRRPCGFDELLQYPMASTPLSDVVARLLVERYGPQAHPAHCVTLRSEDLASLVEVARHSDAVLLAIRAAAPDLVELPLRPPMTATARFGLVTLRRRSEPPGMVVLRDLVARCLAEG